MTKYLIQGPGGQRNPIVVLSHQDEAKRLATVKEIVEKDVQVQGLDIAHCWYGEVYICSDQDADHNYLLCDVPNKHCPEHLKFMCMHGFEYLHSIIAVFSAMI